MSSLLGSRRKAQQSRLASQALYNNLDLSFGMKNEEKRSLLSSLVNSKDLPRREEVRKLVFSSGGLISLDYRRTLWPVLLGIIDVDAFDARKIEGTKPNVQKDLSTIKHDVNRSFYHLNSAEISIQEGIEQKKEILFDIITNVLNLNMDFYYYQGYNDVAMIHQLVCGPRAAVKTLEEFSKTVLRDYHDEKIDKTMAIVGLVEVLVGKLDNSLLQMMKDSGVISLYCLSWTITGFAYDLENFEVVCRLYDVLLFNEHPAFIVYINAALLIHPSHRKDLFRLKGRQLELTQYIKDLPSTFLQTKGRNGSFDEVVLAALELINQIPPERLIENVDLSNDSIAREPYVEVS